jgi:5-methylcytosine-specific restriction endonuclease McrA
VRRAVSERDQERCAFVGETGKRSGSRRGLELDHIEPVARGGTSTVENLRLLCRAHNQHEAEHSFGAEFMERKRKARRL